ERLTRSGGNGDTAAGEPFAKVRPGAHYPAGEGALWPAQLPRRFFIALALQVTEDDRRPVPVGQCAYLLVENSSQFLPAQFVESLPARHFGFPPFPKVLHCAPRPRPKGDALRHSVEPASKRTALSDGSRLADQDEKSCLESVLG